MVKLIPGTFAGSSIPAVIPEIPAPITATYEKKNQLPYIYSLKLDFSLSAL
jgi:hypothetical protein